jgi:hypothetical protein
MPCFYGAKIARTGVFGQKEVDDVFKSLQGMRTTW